MKTPCRFQNGVRLEMVLARSEDDGRVPSGPHRQLYGVMENVDRCRVSLAWFDWHGVTGTGKRYTIWFNLKGAFNVVERCSVVTAGNNQLMIDV